MKKIFTTIICLLFGLAVLAQKGIEGLIQAEKDFAAYSVAHSTKEAFLRFMDSSSMMFDDGNPVKGIEFWEKREKNSAVLDWRPQFAEISASDDFGYTTGPWTFQPTKNDTIVARGQYITVWHINKNGEWKFLVDLGVSNTPANAIEDVRIIDAPKEPEDLKANPHVPHMAPLLRAENSFNTLFEKSKSKAYKTWLSGESILTRNGFLPAVTAKERRTIIDSTPAKIKFTSKKRGTSSPPDMGYSYGTVIINGKSENYLRIWRREKAGWRISLEVLRY